MCKIVTFTNANKLNIAEASEVIGEALLSLERDGFGYAVQGKTNVFGEKCIANSFSSRFSQSNVVTLPIIEKRYESFGVFEAPRGPAVFHGRTSTNDKDLLNCHPMQRESWHLIHNGVVTDSGPSYVKLTTNDSEDVLARLIEGIESVERHLSGYYAFAAIDPHGRLHLCRDSVAQLYVAWSAKIESYVIATTEDLIEEISKELKLKVGPIDKVLANTYTVFEGNEISFSREISPRGFDDRHARHASASLGYEVETWSFENYSSNVTDATSDVLEERGLGEEVEALMEELDRMDESYRIETWDGLIITPDQYHKLDPISQSECLIRRPDGTLIDFESYEDMSLVRERYG